MTREEIALRPEITYRVGVDPLAEEDPTEGSEEEVFHVAPPGHRLLEVLASRVVPIHRLF